MSQYVLRSVPNDDELGRYGDWKEADRVLNRAGVQTKLVDLTDGAIWYKTTAGRTYVVQPDYTVDFEDNDDGGDPSALDFNIG